MAIPMARAVALESVLAWVMDVAGVKVVAMAMEVALERVMEMVMALVMAGVKDKEYGNTIIR